MAKAPITALVMHPAVCDELLRADHVERVRNVTRLLSDTPVQSVDALGQTRSQVEVLITSWGCPPVEPAHVADLPRLKLIVHIGGSVKGFLDDAVWRRGVLVSNAVAANAVPVAEYTLAAILFANKKVFALREFYRRHRENRAPWSREAPNVGNYRKTVGIVGASHVGKLVIERLKSFELNVVLYDPFITPLAARDLGARKLGLSELMAEADVVSLHAPLLKDTYHMIGSRELSLMRDGTTLINTARGALVDPRALEGELTKGRIHAVLDTTDPEVLPATSRLFELPNVFLTPHIAGSLGDEAQRLTDYMVAEVERYVRGNALKHLVLREHLARLA